MYDFSSLNGLRQRRLLGVTGEPPDVTFGRFDVWDGKMYMFGGASDSNIYSNDLY